MLRLTEIQRGRDKNAPIFESRQAPQACTTGPRVQAGRNMRAGHAGFRRLQKGPAKNWQAGFRQLTLPLQGGGDFDATNSQAQLVLL
jgi:hypothetical protein